MSKDALFFIPWFAFCSAGLASAEPRFQGVQGSSVLQLTVDASQAAKQRIQVKEDIPISAGAATLYFPEWIPGTHSPVGGPADSAGLCPGMVIKTVNGKVFSSSVITEAIKILQPIAIQVDYDGLPQNYTIQYSGGLKIPHLERDTTKPDLLTAIISPHAQ